MRMPAMPVRIVRMSAMPVRIVRMPNRRIVVMQAVLVPSRNVAGR